MISRIAINVHDSAGQVTAAIRLRGKNLIVLGDEKAALEAIEQIAALHASSIQHPESSIQKEGPPMAPELLDSIDARELRECALKVQEWQTARKLSDSALARKIPQIGSTKTYRRIINDDLAELDLETQLANYRAAVAFIESFGAKERRQDELYDDLWAAVELRRAFTETSRETGPARLITIAGPTGTGKTCACMSLLNKFGPRLLCVEAEESWNGKPNPFLKAILVARGIKNIPVNQAERSEKVTEVLNSARLGLIIEEGHHLGPRNLNVCKTILNKTPGEIILAGNDTLMKRMELAAYEDASQLMGNRLAERIKLDKNVRERDARLLLTRRVKWADEDDIKRALPSVVQRANQMGRLGFIRDLCTRVNISAGDEAVTLEAFTDALAQEVTSR